MACVMATCHVLDWLRGLGSDETLQFFPHFLWQPFLTLCLSLIISSLSFCIMLFDFSIFPSSQIRPFLLFFSFKSYIFSLSLCFFFLLELYYLLSLPLMVGYSDIRRTSPSVAFFFARLGVFLCSFSDHYPRVRDLF